MASSSEFADSGRFSGLKAEKSPEKSMFSHTCSLLREYLKERPLGELSRGMALGLDGNGNPESFRPAGATTTINLFPTIENPPAIPARNMAKPRNLKSMDLFPQQAGFGSSVLKEDAPKMVDYSMNKSSTTEPEKAQMTIFYAGQVLVFNDFPAEKAKEVMLLASMGSSKNPSAFSTDSVKNSADSGSLIPSSSTVVPKLGNNSVQERNQQPPQPIVCDLPIARKASLTRFLEKRKDR
ncbi:hypothetical protein L1049_022948 [Liquidambar formosana]|uniref:Protein TIFY n=1 Tax=Liquidambar formosana TaxID=63359 RepID=A0AAP0WR00_LIQFO